MHEARDRVDWEHEAPYGQRTLRESAAELYRPGGGGLQGEKILCCIRDCDQWLDRRRRGFSNPGVYCARHGISVSTSPTYVYREKERNFLVGRDLLGAVKKVENWRLANENSEDALSWNLFIGLQKLGSLGAAFTLLTGVETSAEPELYLWGNRIEASSCSSWDRLFATRADLEKGLGIPTEPDVALRIPGKALVLIEAKFGSPNGTLEGKEDRFGCVDDFLGRYSGRDGAEPLARASIASMEPSAVLEQLCRNVVFAQWLAEKGERPFVVNLVRQGEAEDVEQRMKLHLASDGPVTFRREVWERLASLSVLREERAAPLADYLRDKTLRLRPAFALG